MNAAVLRVEGLRVAYDHPLGVVRAVDDVSFSLRAHERFGLAGESGSGKSTMALAILRLIRPPGRIDGGEVWLDDTRLSSLSDDAMRRLRLAGIALVPQGSMNALNPVLRIQRADRRRAGRSRHGAVAAASLRRACAICSARWACRPRWRRCIRTNSPAG